MFRNSMSQLPLFVNFMYVYMYFLGISLYMYYDYAKYAETVTCFLTLFPLQRCPLEQVVLKVKLLDIGPPKAVLRLALQPPDSDDIERTVLLLKQVRKTRGLIVIAFQHYTSND